MLKITVREIHALLIGSCITLLIVSLIMGFMFSSFTAILAIAINIFGFIEERK